MAVADKIWGPTNQSRSRLSGSPEIIGPAAPKSVATLNRTGSIEAYSKTSDALRSNLSVASPMWAGFRPAKIKSGPEATIGATQNKPTVLTDRTSGLGYEKVPSKLSANALLVPVGNRPAKLAEIGSIRPSQSFQRPSRLTDRMTERAAEGFQRPARLVDGIPATERWTPLTSPLKSISPAIQGGDLSSLVTIMQEFIQRSDKTVENPLAAKGLRGGRTYDPFGRAT